MTVCRPDQDETHATVSKSFIWCSALSGAATFFQQELSVLLRTGQTAPPSVIVIVVMRMIIFTTGKASPKNLRLSCRRTTTRASRDCAARLAQGLPLGAPLHLDLGLRTALLKQKTLGLPQFYDQALHEQTGLPVPCPFEKMDEHEDPYGHGGDM